MRAYDLLCLWVLEPHEYSECEVWVGRYAGSTRHRRTASLYTFMITVTLTRAHSFVVEVILLQD